MKKLTKIWGIGLTIVLAASLLFGAVPVSASDLAWGTETVPTTTGNVLADGSDVSDLAVSADGTMYLVNNSSNQCYKSTNGGVSWSKLSNQFNGNLGYVAVSPDDSSIVAVAENTTDNKIWISTNGGSTWGDLGHPSQGTSNVTYATTPVSGIKDLAISNADGSKHYIGVAGATTANTSGTACDVWYFDLGASAPKWNSTRSDGGWPTAAVQTAALAIAFSPNIASDYVMAVITASADNVLYQMYSLNTNNWNATAAYGSYPVNIQNNSTNITGVAAGDAAVVLSPDYLGSDDSLRVAFVGIANGAATAGVYRLKDTTTKDIYDGADIDIGSIDYDGTNLVAGNRYNTKVYRCDDSLASSPSFSTASELKRPGVSTTCSKTIVAWDGADVVAGVTGAGSAFAVSTDNGASFDDLSMIDTGQPNMGSALDTAVSGDGSTIYLLTAGTNGLSLFRKTSSWTRVLATANFTGTPGDGIVRTAPDDSEAVYVADEGATTLYYSAKGGSTKWFTRACKYTIKDIAVESADVAYVAVSGGETVSKTTNSGFTWGSSKDTSVGGGAIDSITSLGEDELIIGSAGRVSWSTDGNSSWSGISTPLSTAGATQVTASGLADGDYVYAATASNSTLIQRWEIGQSGTTWKDLAAPTSSNMSYGIALVEGALYAVTYDATDSYLVRTLSPDTSEPSSGMWSISKSTAEIFNATPRALKISSGSVKLWSVHTTAVASPLFSFTDEVATIGPTLGAPSDGSVVQVNPISGGTYTVALSWSRLSKSTIYDYQVSLDSGFVEKVVSLSTGSTTDSSIAVTVNTGDTANALMPGTTYYWRVRTNIAGPIRSPWSETRSFTVGELPEAQAPVVIQQPPAPVIQVPPAPSITLQPPEIVLPAPPPAPPDIIIPAAPEPTPPVPTWAIYAIIIIGAVLVIALIVLIMRTRRPV